MLEQSFCQGMEGKNKISEVGFRVPGFVVYLNHAQYCKKMLSFGEKNRLSDGLLG